MTAELDSNLHITQTIQSASLICNMIFRCFIVKRPEFYTRLYKSLVTPKFRYCSEVWRPYLKKHIDAIEHVQSKFIRRTALRCSVSRDSIKLVPISELHDQVDLKMYNRIINSENCSKYFNTRSNNLRSGVTVTATEIAKTERINNTFAWRTARMIRQNNFR